MGMRCQVQLLLACSSLCAGFALQQSTDASSVKNPIRMVVTMLQKMQKRVEEEGEAEKKLYDKFMCYCKSGGKELDASISGAENKVSTLPAEITAAEEKLVQLRDDIKEHQADRAGAKAALAKATALRNKERPSLRNSRQKQIQTYWQLQKPSLLWKMELVLGFCKPGRLKTCGLSS